VKILGICAHFEDVTVGCGGSLARHAALGDEVTIYVATDSGYESPDGRCIRAADEAAAEGERAASIIGARLIRGSFNTFRVEFDDDLNRELLGVIESCAPDRIYTHWHGDAHHDHRAVALASLHCARRVPTILAYRSNWYPGTQEYSPTFCVDISAHWDIKARAMKAHHSEMERTRGEWLDHALNEARNCGRRFDVEYGECFQLVRHLDRRDEPRSDQ